MQQSIEHTVLWLMGIGAVIGLGQLLRSQEPITLRAALGRAIVTGGLSVSGALILLVYPDAPLLPVLAAGAFAGSLGTDAIVAVLKKKLGR
jgi:hypothetical protein